MRKGKIDVNVLDRSVIRKIRNASLDTSDRKMSSETVSLETSRIGELAVCKALNALLTDVSMPSCNFTADSAVDFRPTILMPENTDESLLREIIDQICETCSRENLKIEGGYIEVTSAVARPVLIGSCAFSRETTDSGRTDSIKTDSSRANGSRANGSRTNGSRTNGSRTDSSSIRAAAETSMSGFESAATSKSLLVAPDINYIVMTKWAGLAGTYLLSCDREEELGMIFPESMLGRMKLLGGAMSIREEAACALKFFTNNLWHYMQNVSEGGIFEALWTLSTKVETGFCVDLNRIPILQETIETANHYDINPYQMDSTGCLLIVTDRPEELTAELEDKHIPAAVIGTMTADNDKKILNGDEVRYLDRPQPDELLKVYG